MRITRTTAIPLSFRLPEGSTVRLGVGATTKRDAIIVRVETDEGLTGYGEAQQHIVVAAWVQVERRRDFVTLQGKFCRKQFGLLWIPSGNNHCGNYGISMLEFPQSPFPSVPP